MWSAREILLALQLILWENIKQELGDWLHMLCGGKFSVDYDPKEVQHFVWTQPLAPHYTAVGGCSAFGGAWETGLFRTRYSAEKYRTHLQQTFKDTWPILPAHVRRVPRSDPRVAHSEWRY